MASTSRADSLAASITDTEAAGIRALAPEGALEEERRLAKERHDKEAEDAKKEEEAARTGKVALDGGTRMEALEELLNRSEMFSTFVSEQIASEQDNPAFAGAPQPSKAGTKRTRELTPTQRMLPMMNVEMRDYQLKGVKWLISLFNNGLNGILADQMGLGKTVQTIGFLSYLRGQGLKGPFMVIGPLSTLPNWINEFKRFCPDMPVLMYHGTRPEREELRRTRLKVSTPVSDNFPVIVTSYEIVMADSKFLARFRMKYVVVDEGHRLKNFNCKLMRELKTIPAENRLLLSGTPLQNNLDELWSLLNYIMPQAFSNLEDFQGWFKFSNVVGKEDGAAAEVVAAEQRNRMVSKLHSILKPFVLRRLKSDVNIALPEKAEVLLYAHMTKDQESLNQKVLDGTLREGMKALSDMQGGSCNNIAAGGLSNMIMQLRKISNHPDLVTGPYSGDVMLPDAEELVRQCGKMQMLERLLKKLHAGGHKVLIFSQMTKMLDLIHTYLDQTGHRACRIDGSIPWQERQQSIQDFNNDPSTWLFLLSTRAGGLGINLTAADTVIIYDSDWNPHQDLQAMDRCHRIGQTKPCLVLRLATAQSVEGKMLRRAGEKMALERLVIKKGAFMASDETSSDATSLSAAELLDLLKTDVSTDDVPQSGVVSDAMMDRILDRTWLANSSARPFEASGVGYEFIQRATSNTSLLENIEETNGEGSDSQMLDEEMPALKRKAVEEDAVPAKKRAAPKKKAVPKPDSQPPAIRSRPPRAAAAKALQA